MQLRSSTSLALLGGTTVALLVIGVLGQDPFGQIIEYLVADETYRGRKLVIERYASAAEIGDCQLLFVARSQQADWPKVRQAIAGRPILTVSDAEYFAAQYVSPKSALGINARFGPFGNSQSPGIWLARCVKQNSIKP